MHLFSILFLLISSIFANTVLASPTGYVLPNKEASQKRSLIDQEAQICISTTCRLSNDNVACREGCIRKTTSRRAPAERNVKWANEDLRV